MKGVSDFSPVIILINFVQIDDVISQAQATRSVLGSQRTMFGDVQGKVKQLSDKFPVVRGLIGKFSEEIIGFKCFM